MKKQKISYADIDRRYYGTCERRCIDGHVRGCSLCRGYCMYSGHPGFLTQKHIEGHRCIGKKCFYFLRKEKKHRKKAKKRYEEELVGYVQDLLHGYEGFKVMKASKSGGGVWKLYYIAVAGYDIDQIAENIRNGCRIEPELIKLPYTFDNAVHAIFG